MGHPQILQLDSSGQPNKWITWKNAVTYHAKNLVAWELGKVEIELHGGTCARTGERSIVTTSSILAVKGKPTKRRGRAPSLNNRELFQRDHHMCAYCGTVYGDGKLTRDHVIPIAQDGQDIWTNVVTACTRCNQKKDDKRPEQVGMKLLYVPYEPSRIEHMILANRNILHDQMEFLLAYVSDNSPVRKLASKQ